MDMVPAKLRPSCVRALSIVSARAPQRTEVLHGRSTLNVTLQNLRFAASPHAFLQINAVQTEVLYQMIAEAAGGCIPLIFLPFLPCSFLYGAYVRAFWCADGRPAL